MQKQEQSKSKAADHLTDKTEKTKNSQKSRQVETSSQVENSSLEITKKFLQQGLYHLNPVNKTMNKKILARVYSPGVAAVCKAIEKQPSLSNQMTLRGRSVAIVTDGSFLDIKENNKVVFPVMDWLVAQVKFYSGLDAFPFVVTAKKDTEFKQLLRDLATCYSILLVMDHNRKLQEGFLKDQQVIILKQSDVIEETGGEVTDLERTSSVLVSCRKSELKGLVSRDKVKEALKNGGNQKVKQVQAGQFQIDEEGDLDEDSIKLHKRYQGKMRLELDFQDINKLKPHFTEAKLRQLIKQKKVYSKSKKLSAIVTDGTAILGLGNIGPMAGLPVMEGKSLLFKLLGEVQVVPVCIHPRKTIQCQIEAIMNLVGNFYAINLQDIKAPQCFSIQRGLKALKEVPVFHDDQHGTAIVVLAGLINAAKCAGKTLCQCKVVINGAGAAGITISRILMNYCVKDVIVCDSKGAIYEGRTQNMNEEKEKISKKTNKENKQGNLEDVIGGTDVFVGVSVAKALKGEWVKKMNQKSIIFALANPQPEILPDEAKKSGAYIYGSGRSNYENQINNSLVFPGIFMAITKHSIKDITQQMEIKAAEAIAASLTEELSPKYVVPDMLDKNVGHKIQNELSKLDLPKKNQ